MTVAKKPPRKRVEFNLAKLVMVQQPLPKPTRASHHHREQIDKRFHENLGSLITFQVKHSVIFKRWRSARSSTLGYVDNISLKSDQREPCQGIMVPDPHRPHQQYWAPCVHPRESYQSKSDVGKVYGTHAARICSARDWPNGVKTQGTGCFVSWGVESHNKRLKLQRWVQFRPSACPFSEKLDAGCVQRHGH